MHIRKRIALVIKDYSFAQRNNDSTQEEAQLQRLCSGLARVLGRQLASTNGWGKQRWVDDIIPLQVECRGRDFRLVGLMIWGFTEGTTQEWAEPLDIYLSLSSTGRRIRQVHSKAGDGDVGLGSTTWKNRRDWESRPPVERWMFEVST